MKRQLRKSVKPLPVWYRAKDRGERLRQEGGGGEGGPTLINTLQERLEQQREDERARDAMTLTCELLSGEGTRC